MITTCTDCQTLYEAGSEEQANEPERWCVTCRIKRGIPVPGHLRPSRAAADDQPPAPE